MKGRRSIILLAGLICWGYGTVYAADTLEKAIEKQANNIIKHSPRNTVVAIVDIKSGSDWLSNYVMEKLPDYVVNNKDNITFVARNKLTLIIQQELDFQYSGEVSDETMVSIGKKIGARIIVAGSIIEAGRVYNFNIKLLDVESAQILGSYSIPIEHDETMDGFLKGSQVARLALEEARQKQAEREATISTIKNALGIFSDGLYLGYFGSLNMPIGFSFGGIHGGTGFFMETAFSPPAFKQYEHPDSLSYKGNIVLPAAAGVSYTPEGAKTAFLWDLTVGMNINIVKTLLWVNIGAGLEYQRNYRLFTETSTEGSNNVWVQNESQDQFKFLMSAGLYVKLWYFYIQGKYKYIAGEELDASNYGANHISFGAGYVWRQN